MTHASRNTTNGKTFEIQNNFESILNKMFYKHTDKSNGCSLYGTNEDDITIVSGNNTNIYKFLNKLNYNVDTKLVENFGDSILFKKGRFKGQAAKFKPDQLYLNIKENCVLINENKDQKKEGSAFEKLGTTQVKLDFYHAIFDPLNIEIHYGFILADYFFNKPIVNYFLQNIIKNNGFYYRTVNEIPLSYIGLK